jgi:hypothetical protein
MPTRSWTVLLFCALHSAPCHAQGDQATPDLGLRATDTHVDRVVFLPTAETHPKGTLYTSSYEVVLLQLGYALTDRAQLSLLALPFIGEDSLLVAPSLKVNVLRAPRAKLALVSELHVQSLPFSNSGVWAQFGAIGQLCFDSTCRSSVSPSLYTSTQIDDPSNTDYALSLGTIIALGKRVSLLIEPALGLAPEASGIYTVGPLLSYGLRVSGKMFAADWCLATHHLRPRPALRSGGAPSRSHHAIRRAGLSAPWHPIRELLEAAICVRSRGGVALES